jgi:hypothetical protein
LEEERDKEIDRSSQQTSKKGTKSDQWRKRNQRSKKRRLKKKGKRGKKERKFDFEKKSTTKTAKRIPVEED